MRRSCPRQAGFILCTVLIAASLAAPLAAADDVLDGWARRGAVYNRVDMDEGTPRACAALCNGDAMCRAWVWTRPGLNGPDAQCALLAAAPTPYRAPGQSTGLARVLADAIEAAAERPPSPREIGALRATPGNTPQ